MAALFHKEYLYFIIPVVALLTVNLGGIDAGVSNPEFDQPPNLEKLKIVYQFDMPRGTTLNDVITEWNKKLEIINQDAIIEFTPQYDRLAVDTIICDVSVQDEKINRYEVCIIHWLQGDYKRPSAQKDNDRNFYYQHLEVLSKTELDKDLTSNRLMIYKQLDGTKEFKNP